MPSRYFTNWTDRGWFSPNSSVNCCAFKAPNLEPDASMSAGEPGSRRGNMKFITMTIANAIRA